MDVFDLVNLNVEMTSVWGDRVNFWVDGNARVEIYNLNGELVQIGYGIDNFHLIVSELEKGIYVVKVNVGGFQIIKKGIKK